MDLSIKDLILKTETGKPGIAAHKAAAGARLASVAAFDNLLNHVSAASPAPAAPKPAPAQPTQQSRNEPVRISDNDDRSSTTRKTNTSSTTESTAGNDKPAKVTTEQGQAGTTTENETTSSTQTAKNDGTTEANNGDVSGAETAQVLATPAGNQVVLPEQIADGAKTGNPLVTEIQVNTAKPGLDKNTAATAYSINKGPVGNAAINADVSAVNANVGNEAAKTASNIIDAVTTANGAKPEQETALSQLLGATAKGAAAGNKPSTVTADGNTAQNNGAPHGIPHQAQVSVDHQRAASAQPRPLATGLLVAQEVNDQNAPAVKNVAALANQATVNAATVNAANVNAGAVQQTATPADAGQQIAALATGMAAPASAQQATSAQTTFSQGITQGLAGIQGTVANSASTPVSTPMAAVRAQPNIPVPLDQVAVQIARAAATGADHINIKLKPAALGQVEVKLELTHDGRVAAVISADRSDTLDLLQRDAKALERALADAGLKTDSNSLQFNLRGENGRGQGNENSMNAGNTGNVENSMNTTDDQTPALIAGYTNARAETGGIDIQV